MKGHLNISLVSHKNGQEKTRLIDSRRREGVDRVSFRNAWVITLLTLLHKVSVLPGWHGREAAWKHSGQLLTLLWEQLKCMHFPDVRQKGSMGK